MGGVGYRLEGAVATVVMDDGKVNALSPGMLAELGDAFDRAAADEAVVVLAGRPGVFSAGFDLEVLRGGGAAAREMLRAGFELAVRMLSFPRPVVVACEGHAVAMGAFLLLSGDHRVGGEGAYRITANEVAIGLTMPRAGVEICRRRLTPAAFDRAVLLAGAFSPAEAVAAGFLDEVVAAERVREAAAGVAAGLAGLDARAHAGTKLRARGRALEAVRAGIAADQAEFGVLLGGEA